MYINYVWTLVILTLLSWCFNFSSQYLWDLGPIRISTSWSVKSHNKENDRKAHMSDSGGGKSHSTDPHRKVCFFTGYFVIYQKSTAPVV